MVAFPSVSHGRIDEDGGCGSWDSGQRGWTEALQAWRRTSLLRKHGIGTKGIASRPTSKSTTCKRVQAEMPAENEKLPTFQPGFDTQWARKRINSWVTIRALTRSDLAWIRQPTDGINHNDRCGESTLNQIRCLGQCRNQTPFWVGRRWVHRWSQKEPRPFLLGSHRIRWSVTQGRAFRWLYCTHVQLHGCEPVGLSWFLVSRAPKAVRSPRSSHGVCSREEGGTRPMPFQPCHVICRMCRSLAGNHGSVLEIESMIASVRLVLGWKNCGVLPCGTDIRPIALAMLGDMEAAWCAW